MKSLAVALVLALAAPAYADEPTLVPTPYADLCLRPEQQLALAKRLESLRAENEVLRAQPTPLSPWAIAGIVLLGFVAGGAAGYGLSRIPTAPAP